MSLLDQRVIDGAIAVAQATADRAIEQVRGIMFAQGPRSAPPGFRNLETPDDKRVVLDFLTRQAHREEMKTQPGNLAQTAVMHPAVQQMAEEVSHPTP